MKKLLPFLLLLSALSAISGILMSKATLVGRVGISLFYKEYKFLKVWWQGAAVVFVSLLVLLAIQYLFEKYFSRIAANLVHILFILLSLGGLYLTYLDFRHTLSHRLLGERFHLGAYLFWLGSVMVSLFYIFYPPKFARGNLKVRPQP